MKKVRLLAFAILVLFGLSACRATKKIQQVIVKKDTSVVIKRPALQLPTLEDSLLSASKIISLVETKYINFNSFSAKIKVDYYNSKGRQPDFVAHIRMLKDSIIWISLGNEIGIEGIRVLLTKDSVKMLDKLANTYQIRPFKYIQELAQMPFTFSDLQNVFIGNPVFFDKDSITAYSQFANGYAVLATTKLFKNLLSISPSFLVTKSKLDDIDPTVNRTCELIYNDFESRGSFLFSANRKITISQRNKLEILLKFKDYKFNEELTFPFSIPRRFKRI